jgi:REP element-mobilizing transposase RayT
VLVGPVRDRLKPIIEEMVAEHGWRIISLAIQPDHVHLFIRTNPYHYPQISHGSSSGTVRTTGARSFPNYVNCHRFGRARSS